MPGQRSWIVAGTLLVAAGVATACSAQQHWAACRPDAGTAACLALRDAATDVVWWGGLGPRDTSTTALAGVAAVLAGVAWLVVIGWARGSAVRLGVAAVIAGQPLLVAGLADLALLRPGGPLGAGLSGWLTWPAEVLVFPLLLGAGWLLDQTPARTLRLILLGWGVTSFGAVHHFVDYVGSTIVFRGGPGTPAGLGYVTAATQLGAGLIVLVISWRLGRSAPAGDDDQRQGPDGFTLAA